MTYRSIALGSVAAIVLSGAAFMSGSLPARASDADERATTRDLNDQQFDTPSIIYAEPADAADTDYHAVVADFDYQNNNRYDYSGYSQRSYDDHNNTRNAYERGYRDGFIRAQREYGARGAGYDGVEYGPGAGTIGLSFDIGNIAFAYQDGYWDRGRHWHTWRNDDELRYYRNASGNQYYDWKHDRDSDNGWH